jgi:pilus assembly protein CpaF
VVHLRRGRDGIRRLAEIAVPTRDASGLVAMTPAVTAIAGGDLREGAGADRLAALLDQDRT